MTLLFILALAFPPAPRPVQIVFVVPLGETLTNAEQLEGITAVVAATAWWQARTGVQIPLTSTRVLTITGDAYTTLEWARPYLHDANPVMTVFIIDNSASGAWLLGRDAVGEAQDYYGAVWVVLHGLPGDDGLPATITHELGHVAFALNDLPPGSVDIMRMPPTRAYRAGVIGCASLAALAQPCSRVYIPMVNI